MELRPHHVLGYLDYLRYLQDPKREKNYLKYWRKLRGNIHSDKLVMHWESTLKRLNRNIGFKYVPGYDSVCMKCEHSDKCHKEDHEWCENTKRWDDYAMKWLPELKFGKHYNGKFLRELFKKKGWIKFA